MAWNLVDRYNRIEQANMTMFKKLAHDATVIRQQLDAQLLHAREGNRVGAVDDYCGSVGEI